MYIDYIKKIHEKNIHFFFKCSCQLYYHSNVRSPCQIKGEKILFVYVCIVVKL